MAQLAPRAAGPAVGHLRRLGRPAAGGRAPAQGRRAPAVVAGSNAGAPGGRRAAAPGPRVHRHARRGGAPRGPLQRGAPRPRGEEPGHGHRPAAPGLLQRRRRGAGHRARGGLVRHRGLYRQARHRRRRAHAPGLGPVSRADRARGPRGVLVGAHPLVGGQGARDLRAVPPHPPPARRARAAGGGAGRAPREHRHREEHRRPATARSRGPLSPAHGGRRRRGVEDRCQPARDVHQPGRRAPAGLHRRGDHRALGARVVHRGGGGHRQARARAPRGERGEGPGHWLRGLRCPPPLQGRARHLGRGGLEAHARRAGADHRVPRHHPGRSPSAGRCRSR